MPSRGEITTLVAIHRHYTMVGKSCAVALSQHHVKNIIGSYFNISQSYSTALENSKIASIITEKYLKE